MPFGNEGLKRTVAPVSEAPGDRYSKVLVVDDAPEILDVMVEWLRGWGYQALAAPDGLEALRVFNAERPALIVTDLCMPNMDGLALVEAIKVASPETEILILTGHSSVASAVEALRRGVFDYLIKPFDFADFERSVKRALEHCRLVEENRTLVRRLEEQLSVQTQALSATQRRALGVFDSIADPLLIVDREFTILEANEGAATWSGVPAGQLVGRMCYRALFAREGTCPDCPALATFGTGEPASASVRWEGCDGSRDIEVHSFPLVSGAGAIGEVVEHIRDVTEHKRAEAERLALRAQRDEDDAMRVLGRLAGGIAHDFNNQLTVINGCAQFLLDAMPPDAPGREDAERISATVDRGARLVRQLLAFGRKQKMDPRPLSLPDQVNEMATMARPLLGEQVLFRVRAAPGLRRVHADPGQIEQIIMNLVVNARDAMIPPGERFPAGTLTADMANVELDEGAFRPTVPRVVPGPYVMLAVSDTGSGMAPDVRRQVFEPYFTTKEPGRGTGLGLATVFGIVKQHGGHIFCDSEPGQGSTFRVYLPSAGDEEEASGEVPAPTARPGWSRAETVTALVADDDGDVREIVRRGLEASGYRVFTAGGVEEALAMAVTLAGPIHLLVTDLVMPGGSGQALAKRLVATVPALKILFISAYFDETLADPPMPGTRFLQKPFTPEDLARTVRQLLGR